MNHLDRIKGIIRKGKIMRKGKRKTELCKGYQIISRGHCTVLHYKKNNNNYTLRTLKTAP